MAGGKIYKAVEGKQTVLQNAKKKTGAKAQSKQIQRLARQVDGVKDRLQETSIQKNWHCGYSSRTNAYPLIVPLTSGPKSGTTGTAVTNNDPEDIMNWIAWGSFPGGAVNTEKGRIALYSQYVDMILTPGGETDVLCHTVFVVQLRDDKEGMANQTYRRTSNMSSMTEDLDFCTTPDAGGAQAYLNPQLYRIHKRYEFITAGDISEPAANEGLLLTNRVAGNNRVQLKLNYGGRQLRTTGYSEEIQGIAYNDIPPEYKYFIIVFSDNSTIDLENPSFQVHSTITSRLL